MILKLTLASKDDEGNSNINVYSKMLFQTLKDHNSPEAVSLAVKGYMHECRKAAFARGIILPVHATPTESVSRTPINLNITSKINSSVKRELLEALNEIKFTKIEYNLNDRSVDTGQCKGFKIIKLFEIL